MSTKAHWEKFYSERQADELSWFQAQPTLSLELALRCRLGAEHSAIDVGGGSSPFALSLLKLGVGQVTVLDIAAAALKQGQVRYGDDARRAQWVEADVTRFDPPQRYDLWHDRAVFHFLTDPEKQQAYVATLKKALQPGGHAILAAFAPDGPEKCSGLDVARHSPESIQAALGSEFKILEMKSETHTTPWDTKQKFNYYLLVVS